MKIFSMILLSVLCGAALTPVVAQDSVRAQAESLKARRAALTKELIAEEQRLKLFLVLEDQVQSMQTLRGAAPAAADATRLQPRATALYKQGLSDEQFAATRAGHQRETEAFFQHIEARSAASIQWPSDRTVAEYRALVKDELQKLRRDYPGQLNNSSALAASLARAANLLAWTAGQGQMANNPFASSNERVVKALVQEYVRTTATARQQRNEAEASLGGISPQPGPGPGPGITQPGRPADPPTGQLSEALTRAQELAAIGRHIEAVAQFDRVLAPDPRNKLALWGRGLSRVWIGDLKGSVTDHDALLALDPANAEIRRVRTVTALAAGLDIPGALRTATELLRAQPNSAQVLFLAGEAELASGNSAAAQQHFTRAAAADPQLINGVYQQAGQFLQAGVPQMAYLQFMAVVWASPNFAGGHYGAGMSAAKLGYKPQAIQSFEQYLRLDPSSTFATAARQELERLRRAP